MPFDDPFFRDNKTMSPLDHERRMYLETRNVKHAIRALQICGELMQAGQYGCDTLPGWLLEWLMSALARVQDVFAGDVPESKTADAIAEAFGFKQTGQGQRTSAVSDWQLDARDLALAGAVWRAKRHDPTQRMRPIVAAVAAEYHVSRETVFDAWSKWKTFVAGEQPDPPDEPDPPNE